MSDKKVIAVIGATGAQGGGLVQAIVADAGNGYSARAITRNAASDRAQALAATGVHVVTADLDNPGSLRKAFEGAYGAFCITNFWEHFSAEKELAQAKNLAEAAKDARVKHVVWSTLEDTRRWVPLDDDRMPTLMGSYKVPHFDAKGQADAVFKSLVPTTCLLTSFYWENLIAFGMGPKKAEDGTLAFQLPMGNAKLPGISAADIGKCAYGIFKDPARWIGKTVGIAGEHLTGSEMAEQLTKSLGQRVRYQPVPFDVYRGLGFPGAQDLGNMFQFKHDFQEAFLGARDVRVARALNPTLLTFSAWLQRNAKEIPLEAPSGT